MSDPSSPRGPRPQEADVGGPQPGDLIAGKYLLAQRLGQGGMGTVFAATHVQLRDPVALKFLRPHIADNPAMVARFVREARAAVRIKSEHVARVLDVGSLADGAPFIVMELLAGLDLHKLSAQRGPLPIPEAVLFVAQAAAAVAEAHLYGIVHRDLKPANLFLTRRADGTALVKVLDFGISKMIDEEDENLTATTDVLGSPLYMSPEQIRSPKGVDARSDVWALGAILYKLLTGRAAFAAETSSASLAKIVADPPPALRASRPDAPLELEALVLRCLQKNIDQRVQSAADLARALGPFLPEGMRTPVDHTGASYATVAPRPRGRRSAVMIAAAVVTTLLAGGVLVAVLAGRSRDAPKAALAADPPPTVAATAAATATATAAPSATASASPPSSAAAPADATAPPPIATADAVASASAAADRPPAPRKPTTRPNSDAFSDRL